jgi:hypothetical protein
MTGRLQNWLKPGLHTLERVPWAKQSPLKEPMGDAFGATPLGLCSARGTVTQGSSFLATLGFAAESLRDSRLYMSTAMRKRFDVSRVLRF